MLPGLTAASPRTPPLTVFMTADAVGGVWQYALDLALDLDRRGIGVTLAVLGPEPSADQLRTARTIRGLDLRVMSVPLDWTALTRGEVEAAAWRVAEEAARSGAGLVHLNSPALAAIATFPAPVVAVAHSCVATWWAAMRASPLPPDLAWRAELAGEGYRRADAVLAPTRAFAQATAAAYGLTAPPLVVPNGRRSPAERGHRTPGGAGPSPFAFTAGRLWDEGKNAAVLDRIAARLAPRPFLAAGPLDGPNAACFVPRHLRSLGRLSDQDMARWLAGAPVYVSAARYEPFGLGVLEAASAGCALVLSDIPTFRELWDEAAIFLPADDDAGFARTIEQVVGDGAIRARLGAAAKARAEAFTVEAMGAGVLAAYGRVLEAAPRAGASA
ncbi:glycosyltransferase family 4 protein [Methylobacterium isbiliense]|jgi:glycosyltransferase involved in cell wall biosynthesis|uniref:D-inositol-3-phosphate glycosyltransferase n=1 Tax=Methylobacterium isbiliense TaxID=315478 RepID=A0ABQ4SD20_9HYPH|nr:glycosyltransferase family 4 protein [Methylobacterium isbiliense]MDN3625377.1 glycosyltransferase family 4 protein [Methylobacterium isbiliense]GJE01065.1 D-inositol-3-phosphate glycosyltransferase [Methylobacterium isbiliense]